MYKILELRRKKFLLLTLIKNPEMKSNFRNLQKKNIQIAFLLLNYFIGLIKTSSPLNLVYILLHWKIQTNNFMSTHKIHRIPASFQYTCDITFSVRDVVKLKLFEAKFDCVAVEFMFEFEAFATLALIVFKYYHHQVPTISIKTQVQWLMIW